MTGFPSGASSLEQARWYVARGFSLIPVPRAGDGHDGKIPILPWAPYQKRLPTDAEIVAWFSNSRRLAEGVATARAVANDST
jgi:hypothetical protein